MNFLNNNGDDTSTKIADADQVAEQSSENDEWLEGEEEPSDIADLHWGGPRFCEDPHAGCDEPDCPGQTCQYNALCDGNCDSVLNKNTNIYVLERRSRSITVCQWCFENMIDAMKIEGGWNVDDEQFIKDHEYWGESEDDEND